MAKNPFCFTISKIVFQSLKSDEWCGAGCIPLYVEMNLHSNLSFCSFSLSLPPQHWKKSMQHFIHPLTVPKKAFCLIKFEKIKGSKLRKIKTFPLAYLNCATLLDLLKSEIFQNICSLPAAANMQNYSDINTKPELGHMHWHFPFIGFCQHSKCPTPFFLDKHEKVDGQGHSIASLTVSQRNYLSSHKQLWKKNLDELILRPVLIQSLAHTISPIWHSQCYLIFPESFQQANYYQTSKYIQHPNSSSFRQSLSHFHPICYKR